MCATSLMGRWKLALNTSRVRLFDWPPPRFCVRGREARQRRGRRRARAGGGGSVARAEKKFSPTTVLTSRGSRFSGWGWRKKEARVASVVARVRRRRAVARAFDRVDASATRARRGPDRRARSSPPRSRVPRRSPWACSRPAFVFSTAKRRGAADSFPPVIPSPVALARAFASDAARIPERTGAPGRPLERRVSSRRSAAPRASRGTVTCARGLRFSLVASRVLMRIARRARASTAHLVSRSRPRFSSDGSLQPSARPRARSSRTVGIDRVGIQSRENARAGHRASFPLRLRGQDESAPREPMKSSRAIGSRSGEGKIVRVSFHRTRARTVGRGRRREVSLVRRRGERRVDEVPSTRGVRFVRGRTRGAPEENDGFRARAGAI